MLPKIAHISAAPPLHSSAELPFNTTGFALGFAACTVLALMITLVVAAVRKLRKKRAERKIPEPYPRLAYSRDNPNCRSAS